MRNIKRRLWKSNERIPLGLQLWLHTIWIALLDWLGL